jgi:hypothetical protein
VAKRLDHETPNEGKAIEPCYAAWKRAKIERGLEQARIRLAMIPVERSGAI